MLGDAPRLSQSPAPSAARRTMSPEASERKAPTLRRPPSIVTIIIGPENSQETFIVHKDLICHYSPFFSTAFNSTFTEGLTKTMTLPDVDLNNFGLFVHWLYTQKIDLNTQNSDAVLPLAQLWTLAERFQAIKLQNSIMDHLRILVEFAEKHNLKDFLHYAYESKETNPLKRLAAYRMAWKTTKQALAAWIDHLPEGVLVDIVMSLKKEHVRGKPSEGKGMGDAREYYVEAKRVVKAGPGES